MDKEKKAKLVVLGMPLNEEKLLSLASYEQMAEAQVWVGESRKVTEKIWKRSQAAFFHSLQERKEEKGKQIMQKTFFLEGMQKAEWSELEREVEEIGKHGGTIVLCSDTGMPILFDPGKEILSLCRRHGFQITTEPSATSWGTACALSMLPLPFHILGFPPREETQRHAFFAKVAHPEGTLVFLDTPYRFEKLLQECIQWFGITAKSFLAWELCTLEEKLFWGSLEELDQIRKKEGLKKGEFVLLVTLCKSNPQDQDRKGGKIQYGRKSKNWVSSSRRRR